MITGDSLLDEILTETILDEFRFDEQIQMAEFLFLCLRRNDEIILKYT
jgi:hypothetical protein